MPLIHSLLLPPIRCSTRNPNPRASPKPTSLVLRFRPSLRQTVQYLQNLGIRPSRSQSSSPETLAWIISIVSYLESKGFSGSDFHRLSFLCPQIFSSSTDVDRNLAPVFAFLSNDLSASPNQSRDLIVRCPELLICSVDLRLRPSLEFLRNLGISDLSSPTNLNAHLLSTPIEKLVAKLTFLESLGLSNEDSAAICGRFPAIFGYSVEHNLRPKVEYLVFVMRRSVEEVKEFPQYFAFSLEKRIAPRHLHLKERNQRVSLQRMLLWTDARFYSKWK